MSVIFVSRHAGTIDWFEKQGIQIDRHEAHLELDAVETGDVVIGILPIQMVSALCEKGAVYYHLEIKVPLEFRGVELTSYQLEQFGARLVCYEVKKCLAGLHGQF